jgi:hypothetical protein
MREIKFKKGDILILKKEYSSTKPPYNYFRCKVEHIIINTGNHDDDYYAVNKYPDKNPYPIWLDMSSAHVIYEIDLKTLRMKKLLKISEKD